MFLRNEAPPRDHAAAREVTKVRLATLTLATLRQSKPKGQKAKSEEGRRRQIATVRSLRVVHGGGGAATRSLRRSARIRLYSVARFQTRVDIPVSCTALRP